MKKNPEKKVSKIIIVTIFDDGTSEVSESIINYPKKETLSELKEEQLDKENCPECGVSLDPAQNMTCQALYCPSGLAKIIS